METPSTITVGRRKAIAAVVALTLTAGAAGGASAWAATRSFPDVPPTHPFAAEIDWAASHGIVNGYADGTFRPGNTVTRQAAVAFIANYNDTFRMVTVSSDPTSSDFFFNTAECAPGERPLAGGGGTSAQGLMMTDSRPSKVSNGWFVRWESDNDVAVNPSYVEVWALCAPNPAVGMP